MAGGTMELWKPTSSPPLRGRCRSAQNQRDQRCSVYGSSDDRRHARLLYAEVGRAKLISLPVLECVKEGKMFLTAVFGDGAVGRGGRHGDQRRGGRGRVH
ncbi:hypothetical protein PIB30_036119 [Stylosanthes scabra]|uniref:Uncharacterized protein n=1 Tax=Stylosanthes scabra TaxID=79078 RepID=A0ABU6VBK6_9FABA|nr:hypothetical protein [Stylosanthes scabra]